MIKRKFDYEDYELVENCINSILKLIDLIFSYFDGHLIEHYYVDGVLNYLELIFDKFFRFISLENENNLILYHQKLTLVFIIEKIKNLK